MAMAELLVLKPFGLMTSGTKVGRPAILTLATEEAIITCGILQRFFDGLKEGLRIWKITLLAEVMTIVHQTDAVRNMPNVFRREIADVMDAIAKVDAHAMVI